MEVVALYHPDYLDAKKAGEVLNVTPGTARHILGSPDAVALLKTGHKLKVWKKEKVERIKRTRGEKGKQGLSFSSYKKEMQNPPPPPADFTIDFLGRVVKKKVQYRGSVCRFKGCTTPVPTGMLYCSKHSAHFRALQKQCSTHPDSYECHHPKY